MNVMAYSQDGQLIATGGDDGKVGLIFVFDQDTAINTQCQKMLSKL